MMMILVSHEKCQTKKNQANEVLLKKKKKNRLTRKGTTSSSSPAVETFVQRKEEIYLHKNNSFKKIIN